MLMIVRVPKFEKALSISGGQEGRIEDPADDEASRILVPVKQDKQARAGEKRLEDPRGEKRKDRKSPSPRQKLPIADLEFKYHCPPRV